MTEVWKGVPGFPDYEASSYGSVRSLKRGRVTVLKQGLALALEYKVGYKLISKIKLKQRWQHLE